MPEKQEVTHIVLGGSGLEPAGLVCLHCGQSHKIAYPIDLVMMAGTIELFGRLHRDCKPQPNPEAQAREDAKALKPTTPHEWIMGPDTGMSSITIWTVLGGYSFPDYKHPAVPLDPDDFGRCYRLVKRIAGWEARLPEVAEKYPEWKPLVENWAILCALYEEELPTGQAPKLAALMQRLQGAGSSSDGAE